MCWLLCFFDRALGIYPAAYRKAFSSCSVMDGCSVLLRVSLTWHFSVTTWSKIALPILWYKIGWLSTPKLCFRKHCHLETYEDEQRSWWYALHIFSLILVELILHGTQAFKVERSQDENSLAGRQFSGCLSHPLSFSAAHRTFLASGDWVWKASPSIMACTPDAR